MILFLALSPSLDVTYVVDELPEGGQVRPLSVHRVAGGKALNAARAAAALGGRVRAIAALGDPAGPIGEQLAEAGVALRAVGTAQPTRTCVSVFSRATGRLTEIYENAPPIATAWHSVLDALREELARRPAPRWVVVSGSIPETGVDDPLGIVAAQVRSAGARLAVDTHGPALRRALELAPALLKVNRAEAAEALGADAPAARLAERLQAATGGTVVVTDGEAGSFARDGADSWSAAPAGVRGGFPVGSGDSYLGALLAALDGDASIPQALGLAVAAATANALQPGAAVFDPAEVTLLRRDVVVAPGSPGP